MADPSPIAPLIDLATKVLTPSQLRCFIYAVVDGESEAAVGAAYGCTQPAVHQQIHGRRNKPGQPLTGGALQRLRQALEKDPELMAELNLSSPIADDATLLADIARLKAAPVGKDLTNWFKQCRPDPQHVAALGVLALLDALCDEERRVTFTVAHAHAHPAIIAACIPVLRSLGMLMSDGQVIRILRVPA